MGVLKVWDGTDWRKVGCGGGTATPSFVSRGAHISTGIGTTQTTPSGGSIAVGDLLLFFVRTFGASNVTTPTGWTLVRMDDTGDGGDPGNGSQRAYIFSKIADSTDAAASDFTVATDNNSYYTLEILAFRDAVLGADAGSAVHYPADSTNPLIAPSVTAAGAGLLVASFGAHYNGSTSSFAFSTPTGMTSAGGDVNDFDKVVSQSFYESVSAGASGTRSSTTTAPPYSFPYYGTAQAVMLEPAPTTGRLRLWTGTGWVREACDDDTTTLTDTFDRANSSSNPNPASDGGTWTVDTGTAGISSNQLYFPTAGSSIGTNQNVQVSRDLGSPVQDVTVTNSRSGTSGSSFIIVNWDPALGSTPGGMSGYIVMFDSTSGYGSVSRMGSGPSASCAWTSTWTGSSAVLRVTSDGAGTITVYQGGTQVAQITSAEPSFSDFTGTWVALATNTNGAGLDRWNDFNATGGPIAHPLKIEDPSSPGDWITVGCFVPV